MSECYATLVLKRFLIQLMAFITSIIELGNNNKYQITNLHESEISCNCIYLKG